MPQSDSDVDRRILWCGNLHPDVTEELVYELFLQAGPLETVKIVRPRSGPDGTPSANSGYAFITFQHEVSVPYALQLMNGIRLYNQALRLQTRGAGRAPGTPTIDPPSGRGGDIGGDPSKLSPLTRSSSFPGRIRGSDQTKAFNEFITPHPPSAAGVGGPGMFSPGMMAPGMGGMGPGNWSSLGMFTNMANFGAMQGAFQGMQQMQQNFQHQGRQQQAHHSSGNHRNDGNERHHSELSRHHSARDSRSDHSSRDRSDHPSRDRDRSDHFSRDRSDSRDRSYHGDRSDSRDRRYQWSR